MKNETHTNNKDNSWEDVNDIWEVRLGDFLEKENVSEELGVKIHDLIEKELSLAIATEQQRIVGLVETIAVECPEYESDEYDRGLRDFKSKVLDLITQKKYE